MITVTIIKLDNCNGNQTMKTNHTHGGKRTGAGRKSSGKETAVIRVDAELLPMIEQLKQGLITVTDNQAEIDKLKEVNALRVKELDSARLELMKAKTELNSVRTLKAENSALKAQLNKQKTVFCQCLTAKGMQCTKTASHEVKRHGFILWVCEQHYKALS